jgi:PAS domain S-box-containing protein
MITSNAKILCVDDDPALLNINASILRSAGYEVLEAKTGNECLDTARKEHPDLILLDVVLPDIDGFEVCKQIKSDRELFGIYVILISGKEIYSETQAKGLEAGADGYIVGTVSGSELMARIQAMIRLKQAETAQMEMNARLNTLIDSIPDAIFFKDIQREHFLVNKAAERMTGLKKEQFLGKTSEQILPPDLAEMCLKSDEEVIKRHELIRIEEQMTNNKGEIIFLDTIKSPVFNDQGIMTGFVGLSRDITNHKKSEETLKKAKKEAEEAKANPDWLR